MKYLIALSSLVLVFSTVIYSAKAFANSDVQVFYEKLGGDDRSAAKVYVPTGLTETGKLPLVVALHGYGGTADLFDAYLGLSDRVVGRKFILLTPDGTQDVLGMHFWNAMDSCCDLFSTKVNDVNYLLSLIKRVAGKYPVDANRIYLVGHSNGGYMVNRLACENGRLFAGIVSFAGATFKTASECHDQTPVAFLQIHSVNDSTVNYIGESDYAGGTESVQQWIHRNSCVKTPISGGRLDLTKSIPGQDANAVYWKQCSGTTEVGFWTIDSHSYGIDFYSAHLPDLQPGFTDLALDFLMRHHR